MSKNPLFLICVLLGLSVTHAQSASHKSEIDWPSFLSYQDPVWERLPTEWNDGAFLGNGELGDMVYADLSLNGLIVHLGRSDVTDHRNVPKDLPPYLKGKRPDSQVWGSGHTDTYRIDIGDLILHPAGTIQSGTMRLDLWNAEARGTLITSLGRVDWKVLVHSKEMLTICEVTSTEKTQDGKPAQWKWDFQPAAASSPKWLLNPKDKMFAKGYNPNPDPVVGREGEVNTCTETLLAGGDFSTAWKESVDGTGRGILFATVANMVPETGSAKVAVKTIVSGETRGIDALRQSHREWWHDYYPLSFESIPNGKLQSHYWVQMYKLATATRSDRALIDNTGPYFRINNWPYATWDLNVQLSYRTFQDANRDTIGLSLARYMGECGGFRIQGSRKNPREIGDWLWVSQVLWNQYRHSMDKEFLRASVYPILRQSLEIALAALVPGEDGRLHLPPMQSPEYSPTGIDFPDNNYDLALIKWGCRSLLEASEKLSIDEALAPKCRQALDKLIDPPLDQDGTLMVARDVPYTYSHRHYSHLIGIYPLHLYNWENPESRPMIENSARR